MIFFVTHLSAGPPEIMEKDFIEKETSEKEVELTCHVRGYPTPQINWTTSDGKVLLTNIFRF